jgi:hypothetical protein
MSIRRIAMTLLLIAGTVAISLLLFIGYLYLVCHGD